MSVDSHFAFRPVSASARDGARALAQQAIDILPHPLYTLIDVLERCGGPGTKVEVASALAGPADLHVLLRAGAIVGRLTVSLRARPVASSLTVTGTNGALTCDFVRSTVVGAANPGTEALEEDPEPNRRGPAARCPNRREPGTTVAVGRQLSGTAAAHRGVLSSCLQRTVSHPFQRSTCCRSPRCSSDWSRDPGKPRRSQPRRVRGRRCRNPRHV